MTMKNVNKGVFLLSVLLLVMASVLAAETKQPDIKVTGINSSIYKFETASYTLTIKNLNDFEDKFQFSTLSTNFVVWAEPKLESVPIAPGSFQNYIISVNPKDVVGIGPFGIPVKIKSLVTGEFYTFDMPINIKIANVNDPGYTPQIALSADLPKYIDPRNAFTLTIIMRNRNPLDIPGLTVQVDSALFSKEYTTTLASMEEKSNELAFTLADPYESPGMHTMKITLYFKNKTVSEVSKTYTISGYSNIDQKSAVKKSLFKTTTVYSFYNDGNKEEMALNKYFTGYFRNWFTTATPAGAMTKDESGRYLGWDVILGPKESAEITVTENYRLLVSIIIIIIAVIIAYFIFRSPIVSWKDARLTESKEGISDIKVKIIVKNRSRKTLKNIRIIDRIPAIAEFVKSEEFGTMHPSRLIKDSKKGLIARWDMVQLDPYEERFITYKMKSRLKIVGGISLPAAKVKFETRQGIERVTLSNEVNIERKHEQM
ncbi:MAG: hypothetical protein V1743_06770 [Nanoarchaeota archaeon]